MKTHFKIQYSNPVRFYTTPTTSSYFRFDTIYHHCRTSSAIICTSATTGTREESAVESGKPSPCFLLAFRVAFQSALPIGHLSPFLSNPSFSQLQQYQRLPLLLLKYSGSSFSHHYNRQIPPLSRNAPLPLIRLFFLSPGH